jgi:hypothetical protein
MENWREYIDNAEHEEIFEQHKYITNVLGVKLPLDESGQVHISEELRKEIIQEHILYENFVNSLLDRAKESTGKIKTLFAALYEILNDKEGEALTIFVEHLARYVIKPVIKRFRMVFKKMSEIGGKVAEFIGRISEIFEGIFKKFDGLSSNWKKAMIGSSIALLLQHAYDQVSDMAESLLSGDIKESALEEFIKYLKDKFIANFGEDLFKNIASHLTNIKTYLGWIGPLVGGVNFVAQTLYSATNSISSVRSMRKGFGDHRAPAALPSGGEA